MEPVSAPGYDRFKTVVTLILAVIIILMLLRGCATNPASPAPMETVAAPNATETLTPLPASTETAFLASTADLANITATPSASALPPTAEPTVTTAAEGPTSTPTSAATEAPAATPTQAAPTQAQDAACNTSAPSRLAVGQTARVIQRLNMRSDASIEAAIIQTNPVNSQVEIIGGPVCTPVGERAYLWWQIRLPDGAEGWSAETSLNAGSYFLEPVP